MQSISTFTPLRCGVPPMQVRVTFSPARNSRKVSLNAGKSSVLRSTTRMLTTFAMDRPAAERMFARLPRVWRVGRGDDLFWHASSPGRWTNGLLECLDDFLGDDTGFETGGIVGVTKRPDARFLAFHAFLTLVVDHVVDDEGLLIPLSDA